VGDHSKVRYHLLYLAKNATTSTSAGRNQALWAGLHCRINHSQCWLGQTRTRFRRQEPIRRSRKSGQRLLISYVLYASRSVALLLFGNPFWQCELHQSTINPHSPRQCCIRWATGNLHAQYHAGGTRGLSGGSDVELPYSWRWIT
jgi:hypothetical protein